VTKKSAALSLYVHWPFCLAKCPYCDFNSHVAQDIDTDLWQQALIAELETQADFAYQQLGVQTKKLLLKSLFFGGGTPSLMPPTLIQAILDKAASLFAFDDQIEITAEANPTSVETDKLQDFRLAGINRLSLGVQSLRKQGLAFLGREHSAHEALDALAKAAHIFDRWSADLIYGLPEQTPEDWQAQLEEITQFLPTHLSCYQLTVEPGTIFYTLYKQGQQLTTDPDKVADLYLLTESVLHQKGLKAYEISNYAKEGHASVHNMNYWQAGNWLGIGPGAHSRLTTQKGRYNRVNRRSPSGWLEAVKQTKHGSDTQQYETARDHFNEIWMMGLRLTSGIVWPDLTQFSDPSLSLNKQWLERFIEEGWLVATKDRLATTLEGRLRLDSILSHLLD